MKLITTSTLTALTCILFARGGYGIPAPPAASCEGEGTYEIRYDSKDNQYGVCIYDDGTVCSDYFYYRGECHEGMTLPPQFSVFCGENRGHLLEHSVDGGDVEGAPPAQYDVCAFEDGTECDEHSYYQGGCQASGFCDENGGTNEIRYEQNGGQYGLCIFDDGTACDDWSFYLGKCEKGSMLEFSAVCVESGGQLVNSSVNWVDVEGAAPAQYLVCSTEDGTTLCEENDYYSYQGGCFEPEDGFAGVGMPNPAAAYCNENGGTNEIRYEQDGGQYGLCIFDDGSVCDDWFFYRSDCEKGFMLEFSVVCVESGGQLVNRSVELAPGDVEGAPPAQYLVCTLKVGTVCDEASYYHGGCVEDPEREETPPPGVVSVGSADDTSGAKGVPSNHVIPISALVLYFQHLGFHLLP